MRVAWSVGTASRHLTTTATMLMTPTQWIRIQREPADIPSAWAGFSTHRGWDVCMAELRVEVATLLVRREALMDSPEVYHPYHDPREYVMEQHYFQWLVRKIYHLYYLEFLQ
ncbi:hypothetical protein B0H14DRAFT_3462639 [Mycena olivaceomarginata]|nr:hypothetical protein B0H14DRAFT_3462639 [Mycena olivaceomarginata]